MTDAHEPNKVVPEENRTRAETEVPEENVPFTKEQFAAQMQLLADRARAAGLNPIQMMAKTYVKQGAAILEGILTALEHDDNDSSKKK